MSEINHSPVSGEPITLENGQWNVPDQPIVPFIEGDGIGPDIWKASKHVMDSAVEKCYGGKRKIHWFEIYAGEKCHNMTGKWILDETFDNIKKYKIAIKGPLTTPVGGGIRSLNVTLRQVLDLYACVRPVRWFDGVPAPVKRPQDIDMVIFRENTEDVYAGIEWKEGSDEVKKVLAFLKDEMGKTIREDSGIGIKPISETGSKRLVLMALEYTIANKRASLTLMHKGNIMKFTEGAFKDWGYEVCKEAHPDKVISEADLWDNHDGKVPEGKIVIKDRIADAIFQQVLLRPTEYDVIATTNLNGDFISDALVAQVGGLGLAPGANMSKDIALFEATHGTAPKYAGQDKVNPGSVLLSGCLMLEHMGWNEAADAITEAISKTIGQKKVTYDLARQMEGANELKCSEFGNAIVENL